MVRAAENKSLRVLRMRPWGRAGSSPFEPWTSGITDTPVSKPESPRARRGKRRRATPSIAQGLPWAVRSASFQRGSTSGWISTS